MEGGQTMLTRRSGDDCVVLSDYTLRQRELPSWYKRGDARSFFDFFYRLLLPIKLRRP